MIEPDIILQATYSTAEGQNGGGSSATSVRPERARKMGILTMYFSNRDQRNIKRNAVRCILTEGISVFSISQFQYSVEGMLFIFFFDTNA